jgi:hypothetical protein
VSEHEPWSLFTTQVDGEMIYHVQYQANSSRCFGRDKDAAETELNGLLNGPRCVECGSPILLSYFEPTRQKLIDTQTCFGCNVWHEKAGAGGDQSVAIVNGTWYRIGDERPSRSDIRGFAGRRFTIVFDDGRLITTTNLWCGGDIPSHFQERLPNNASFALSARPVSQPGGGEP